MAAHQWRERRRKDLRYGQESSGHRTDLLHRRCVVAKLRRLADALEADKSFRIQIAGVGIRVLVRAQFSIEHERDDDEEEIEFQLKWSVDPDEAPEPEHAPDAPVV